MNEAQKRFNDMYKLDRQELNGAGHTIFIFEMINSDINVDVVEKVFNDFLHMLSLDVELGEWVTGLFDTGQFVTYSSGDLDNSLMSVPRGARIAFEDNAIDTVFKLKYL